MGAIVTCFTTAAEPVRAGSADEPASLEHLSVGDRNSLQDICPKSILGRWTLMRAGDLDLFTMLTFEPGRLGFGEKVWFDHEVRHAPNGHPYFRLATPFIIVRLADKEPLQYLSVHYPHPDLPPEQFPCYAAVVACPDEASMVRSLETSSPGKCREPWIFMNVVPKKEGPEAAESETPTSQLAPTAEEIALERLRSFEPSRTHFYTAPPGEGDGTDAGLATNTPTDTSRDDDEPRALEHLSIGDRGLLPARCAKSIFNRWTSMSRSTLYLLGTLTIRPGQLYFSQHGWFDYEVRRSPEGLPYFYLTEPLVIPQLVNKEPLRYWSVQYPHPDLPPEEYPCYAAVVDCKDEANMLRNLRGESAYCSSAPYINAGAP